MNQMDKVRNALNAFEQKKRDIVNLQAQLQAAQHDVKVLENTAVRTLKATLGKRAVVISGVRYSVERDPKGEFGDGLLVAVSCDDLFLDQQKEITVVNSTK